MKSPHDHLEIMPICTECGCVKQPRGRSAGMGELSYCHSEKCEGYSQEPYPSSYWSYEEPHLITGQVVLKPRHGRSPVIRDGVEVLNERDARLEPDVIALVGYKLCREGCYGWCFAGVTPSEVAETLKNELDNHDGLAADECGEIGIVAYETTQAEIDALPEFEGW